MRSGGRRRATLAVAAAGLAVATVSGVQLADRAAPRSLPREFTVAAVSPSPPSPSPPSQSPPSQSPAAPDAAAVLAAAPTPTPSPSPGPSPVEVGPDGSTPPVRLRIPSLRVDAPVRAVADARRDIDVPDDVRTVGWWVGGAAPGAPAGTVVLVGHVDSLRQGAGALYHLDAARPGARIDVATAEAGTASYTVSGLQVISKRQGLPASVFSADSGPRLVLITCGGPFDEKTHSYRDNIVVTAAPV